MKITGAQIVIECLVEQGVKTVFGYPGGAILNIYDELYKHQDRITHVLTAHEQAACHAADGYSRSTGKVGVCMATSGPGATNLVTGIATAYMDSIPIVAITCNVPQNQLGKDSFQEIDICGVTMPITKHNFMVRDVTKLADTIREAFLIAKSGRPGPVLIDIPKDITAAVTEYTFVEGGKLEPSKMGTESQASKFLETSKPSDEEILNLINNKYIIDTISVNAEGKLQLTTSYNQYVADLRTGTEILLPNVNDYIEIHLYFNPTSDVTLTFPPIKWQSELSITANKSYEIILTHIGSIWLAGTIVYV